MHTVIQKVLIRKVSWRFYAKSKFCVCFEVHIPVRLFQIFESWSSFKLNLGKSELCGIGVKKGEDLAFCGCKVVNLDKDTVKILGTHFSYNMLLADSRNFAETISKIEEILSIWSYRALTLIGRISIFKILC